MLCRNHNISAGQRRWRIPFVLFFCPSIFSRVFAALIVQTQLAKYAQLKPGRFLVIVAGHIVLKFAATARAALPQGTSVLVADGIQLVMITEQLLFQVVWKYPVIAIETVNFTG